MIFEYNFFVHSQFQFFASTRESRVVIQSLKLCIPWSEFKSTFCKSNLLNSVSAFLVENQQNCDDFVKKALKNYQQHITQTDDWRHQKRNWNRSILPYPIQKLIRNRSFRGFPLPQQINRRFHREKQAHPGFSVRMWPRVRDVYVTSKVCNILTANAVTYFWPTGLFGCDLKI